MIATPYADKHKFVSIHSNYIKMSLVSGAVGLRLLASLWHCWRSQSRNRAHCSAFLKHAWFCSQVPHVHVPCNHVDACSCTDCCLQGEFSAREVCLLDTQRRYRFPVSCCLSSISVSWGTFCIAQVSAVPVEMPHDAREALFASKSPLCSRHSQAITPCVT
jgi:hypothetical protein